MNNWMKEFDTFIPPHADIFIAATKLQKKLDEINREYDKLYPIPTFQKLKVVTFDVLPVKYFFTTDK